MSRRAQADPVSPDRAPRQPQSSPAEDRSLQRQSREWVEATALLEEKAKRVERKLTSIVPARNTVSFEKVEFGKC